MALFDMTVALQRQLINGMKFSTSDPLLKIRPKMNDIRFRMVM